MADQPLSREEQLVAFFINACGEVVGRKRLMKLLYLADYHARQYFGHPISSIPYRWHDHGPFDESLYTCLDRLEERDIIRHEQVPVAGGATAHHYVPKDAPPAHEFTPDEVEILSYVCREYSKRDIRELLEDIVYQTEPMLDAKKNDGRNKLLRMEIVDNAKGQTYSIPYKDLLARSRHLRSGAGVGHAQAMMRLSTAMHASV
jgi:uncharacterized phage-associated protein